MCEYTRRSSQIAVGGVFSSLCLLVMFMSSLIPFSTYIAPALAGVMLTVIVIENGSKIALMVYISVSLLSIIIVPDYEVKALFIAFFGYYPIIKFKIEKISSKYLQYILKLAIFSSTMSISYLVLINIVGVQGLVEEFSSGIINMGMLLVGGATFLVYDFSLAKYVFFYKYRLKALIIK